MILAVRTDKPEAELYLLSETNNVVDSYKWQAHRELSDTLLEKVESLLNKNDLSVNHLNALVIYKGPGSFTGLRIGVTFVNTLAYALNVPVYGTTGDNWLEVKDVKAKKQIIPEYGALPNITKPKK